MLEVLTALTLLGLISSSVLFVVNRCMASASDSVMRMQAFRLARENLETILASDSISATAEYGTSDMYPDITWQTVVEAFTEPVTGQMWGRAVCSADYVDAAGETQTVELVHWIAELTAQQADQLLEGEDIEGLRAEQEIATAEEAAEYAGVTTDVIDQWVEAGLVAGEDGSFIKYNLDLYIDSNGNPTAEQKAEQVDSVEALAMLLRAQQQEEDRSTAGDDPAAGASSDEAEPTQAGEGTQSRNDR